MIEYKNDKGKVELNAIGELPELCADTTMLITSVYEKLYRKNKTLALVYRYALCKNIEQGLPFEIGDLIEEDPCEELKKIIERIFKKGE